VLYRAAEEALRNAVRHASAKRIVVCVGATASDVWMEVTDDSVGFDPSAITAKPAMGLFMMRERVALVDGECEVAAVCGRGTTIRVRVPWMRDKLQASRGVADVEHRELSGEECQVT
jgi:two-component system NarL family sensor kinase